MDRARPPGDDAPIPASQLLHGNPVRAARLLRTGGWAAVSQGFAEERHLALGATSVAQPSGAERMGVAAITTNLGWPPGAVILSARDYRRCGRPRSPQRWRSTSPRCQRAAGGGRSRARSARPGLGIQTFAERPAQYAADSRQGLDALSEITMLLLIAAALAVASALSAAIWQRRARLASLKIQGYGTAQLWRALLLESAIVLGVGCAVGAARVSTATRWQAAG